MPTCSSQCQPPHAGLLAFPQVAGRSGGLLTPPLFTVFPKWPLEVCYACHCMVIDGSRTSFPPLFHCFPPFGLGCYSQDSMYKHSYQKRSPIEHNMSYSQVNLHRIAGFFFPPPPPQTISCFCTQGFSLCFTLLISESKVCLASGTLET